MKYLKCLLLSISLLLLCLVGVGAEQVDPDILTLGKVENPPNSVKLEYKFTDGESRRYDVTTSGYGSIKLSQDIEAVKLQSNAKMTLLQKASTAGAKDGTWNIKWEMASGNLNLKGFGDMPLQIPTIEVAMDKYGAVKQVSGAEKLSTLQGMPQDKSLADIISQLKSLGFPQKELRPNENWSQDYTIQLPDGKPITIKTTSTLSGYERIFKTDCARIRTTYEVPFSYPLKAGSAPTSASDNQVLKGTEKGEFWIHFAYNEGKIMQSYGTIELTADLSTDSSSEEKPVASATSGESPAANAEASHNLSVKYDISMNCNSEPLPQPKINKADKSAKGRK